MEIPATLSSGPSGYWEWLNGEQNTALSSTIVQLLVYSPHNKTGFLFFCSFQPSRDLCWVQVVKTGVLVAPTGFWTRASGEQLSNHSLGSYCYQCLPCFKHLQGDSFVVLGSPASSQSQSLHGRLSSGCKWE